MSLIDLRPILKVCHPEEKLRDVCSCEMISEKKSIKGKIHHHNREYVITGFVGNGRLGIEFFFAVEVLDISRYQGSITPLEYGSHFAQVDRGLRERSYVGMIIKYGKRTLVGIDAIHIIPGAGVSQLSLF
ncbi:hypothetical protein [Dyadobacter bucti]|uniref:hypothetical protein n=1 Tax=Dyadobacter bucti TaxID=2572203 RepID=UPI003F71EBEE